jgi:hypothetical protein
VTALLGQVGALALLVCGLWIGWRRWIKPYRQDLDVQGRGLLMLAVLTAAGGLIGAPFWWMDYPNSFSWALAPLAARLLAAAGIAFAITGCYALESRNQRLIRSYIVMLAVYLAPLVAAILLFHLERFDWHAPITYAFFTVAVGMAVAAIWHLARGTTLGKSFHNESARDVPAFAQVWLWLVAAIAGLWGLALFFYPHGPIAQIWIWPWDALTSRLIATMLLTLCAGAILALWSAAQARMSLWMFVVYGVGAAAASLWNLTAGKPVPKSYAGAFSVLAVVSLVLLTIGTAKGRLDIVHSKRAGQS